MIKAAAVLNVEWTLVTGAKVKEINRALPQCEITQAINVSMQ